MNTNKLKEVKKRILAQKISVKRTPEGFQPHLAWFKDWVRVIFSSINKMSKFTKNFFKATSSNPNNREKRLHRCPFIRICLTAPTKFCVFFYFIKSKLLAICVCFKCFHPNVSIIFGSTFANCKDPPSASATSVTNSRSIFDPSEA